MRNAHGQTRLGILARDLSWQPAIRWTALEEPGHRLHCSRRDPDNDLEAAATTPGQTLTVDPLLPMLGKSRQDLYGGCNNAHSLTCGLSNWRTGTLRKFSQGPGGTVKLASILVLAATHIAWALDWPGCSIAA
jgi:hypothetical protein